MTLETEAIPRVVLTREEVFARTVFNPFMPATTFVSEQTDEAGEVYIELDWEQPVQYFVGRNGSGKSRAARRVAEHLANRSRVLATDRLVGLMNFTMLNGGAAPTDYRGAPLGEQERQQVAEWARRLGVATDELYTLREQPEVLLRVAAFIRRALGRTIELRESSGFLDPFIRLGDVEYSLLRDEGHGLRELVVLLAAIYRRDWSLLVVDEPELHLHPSMARLWLTELNRECARSGRRALVVTHEPSFLRPSVSQDLAAIWIFAAGSRPIRFSDSILESQLDRVTASIAQNPQIVGQLVFSPRPVLVEGITDVAAISTALVRIEPPEVVAQTDIVDCGGSGGVGLWLEVCTKLGLDVRAVADLDALFSAETQRAVDSLPGVASDILIEFAQEPATLGASLRPLIQAADKAGAGKEPASRAAWLAAVADDASATAQRKTRILDVLRRHGLWVHPQGALEQVLGISSKGVAEARAAASSSSALDEVARWVAYELDTHGDVRVLLDVAVERVAHSIMEAQRNQPGVTFNAPVGVSARADSQLVTVEPIGASGHRITVVAPSEFRGYWLEFTRDTPSTELNLRAPE